MRDPQAALDPQEDGSATAPATPPATSESETQEQKIARLEREKQEAIDRAERERQLRLSHQSKVEEANQILEESRRSAPPPATADPLDQRVALLQEQVRLVQARGQIDPAAEEALDNALAKQRARDMQRMHEANIRRWEAEFAAMKANPETAPFADRAKALFQQGGYATTAIALNHARAEAAPDLRKQLEAAQKRAEEAERDLKARGEGRVSAGSAPVVSLERPPDPGMNIRIKRSDWAKLETLPVRTQHDYLAAYNAGRVEFIDG